MQVWGKQFNRKSIILNNIMNRWMFCVSLKWFKMLNKSSVNFLAPIWMQSSTSIFIILCIVFEPLCVYISLQNVLYLCQKLQLKKYFKAFVSFFNEVRSHTATKGKLCLTTLSPSVINEHCSRSDCLIVK